MRAGLVLVVMIAVGRVQVAVVQIIHVVPVGHGNVSAVGSVHMVVLCVLHAFVQFAGIPMIIVTMVQVAIVHVVDVVAVWHGHVAAVGAVHVRVFGIGPVIHERSMSFVPSSGSSLPDDVVSNGAWVACSI